MSDLFDLLSPHMRTTPRTSSIRPDDVQVSNYLNRLSTLSLSELTSAEASSLDFSEQTHARNLQALSTRSHKAVLNAASHLESLHTILPSLGDQVDSIAVLVPDLKSAATEFAKKYDRNADNALLERRKRAMLLSRNVDRITDVLELPSLLASTVTIAHVPGATTSAATNTAASVGISATTSYASALDLHAQVRRLHTLYPRSRLVDDISKQAEQEMLNMTSGLLTSLQNPSLKLAAAMRTIGLLGRVASDLADDGTQLDASNASRSKGFASRLTSSTEGRSLGALFLICRLHTVREFLHALEPMRELADLERSTVTRKQNNAGTPGSQSEKYLKRYIEIFREHSFNIVNMYKSIFPDDLTLPEHSGADEKRGVGSDSLLPIPSPLASFALQLTDMLTSTLQKYLPNVIDSQARESLLTQVLYCASSLGRLGSDFGLTMASLEGPPQPGSESATQPEWARVMKKHKIQASRLEVLARGVGSGSKSSGVDVAVPDSSVAVK